MSPLKVYLKLIDQGTIKKDVLQNDVIHGFEYLYTHITEKNSTWFFNSRKPFFGLYIYGSVGRGKTFLMDLFVNTLNPKIVRRQHFHDFMIWFHQQLHKTRNQQNPINIIIKRLSKKITVLCLDEFLVLDITDAMILSKILTSLEKYKMCLVTTSNIAPTNLYKNGLQRKKFLPTINWIEKHMQVLQLDGSYDYRLSKDKIDTNWLSPITSDNTNKFESIFNKISNNEKIKTTPIIINKRNVEVIKRSKNVIMFRFDTLCEQARNAHDYLLLCETYDTLFIIIPNSIEDADRNTARRFITLIDILYDNNKQLHVLSEYVLDNLYKGDELEFEMKRTKSRLMQML